MAPTKAQTGVRQHNAAEALRLYRLGFSVARISGILDLNSSYIYDLMRDPDGSKRSARKRSYERGGACVECGSPTTRRKNGAGYSRQCQDCWRKNCPHTYWTEALLIDAFREWNRRYGRPPRQTDWNCGKSSTEQQRARFRGDVCWPYAKAVQKVFGSWSAGLEAAGFIPNAWRGYDPERVA